MDAAAPPSSHPASSVSLRPGGGGRSLSFRPYSAPNQNGAKGPDAAAVSINPNVASSKFVMRAADKLPRAPNDTIRYTRDQLLQFRDACTAAPEELVNSGIDGLTADTGVEEEWSRREPRDLPQQPAGRPVEPDTRDWKARAPASTLSSEERSSSRELQRERNPKQRNENRGGGGRDHSNSGTQGQRQQHQQQENIPAGPAPAIVKAANPWMARRGAQSEKEKVYRTVKGILNKLTPEKYDLLAEQMMHAGISSAEILQGVISLIFDKAVLEPTFCAMYAQLCVQLSKELPEFPGEQPGDKP